MRGMGAEGGVPTSCSKASTPLPQPLDLQALADTLNPYIRNLNSKILNLNLTWM